MIGRAVGGLKVRAISGVRAGQSGKLVEPVGVNISWVLWKGGSTSTYPHQHLEEATVTDAEKIAKLELLLSKTARVIPGLLLYNAYPNDSFVKEAIEVLRELARDAGDQQYYGQLLKAPIVEDIIRQQR